MEDREIQRIMIEMLYTEINEVESDSILIQKVTEDNLLSIYRLAKQHDLAHVVYNYIKRNKITLENKELRATLKKEEALSLYRYVQMKHTYEQVCNIFDEANISYVPLKGLIIRPYYPCENMRTSCDIDILIHEEHLELAISCLENKGYVCGNKRYHDVSIFSPNKINLELHFSIQENVDYLDNVLKDAWKHTVATENSRYEFTKEFFVFHMYAHMAHHFLSGGCGIRSLLDIWVMEHKMNASYLCARDLLERAEIYGFATEMSIIANKCFSENVQDSFSELVLKYIYSGGVYGSEENKIAVEKSIINSSIVYVMKRLFLPYKWMILAYPILKKLPVLLPFCWIARWGKIIGDRKFRRIKSEISCANNISNTSVKEIKEIRSRMKL